MPMTDGGPQRAPRPGSPFARPVVVALLLLAMVAAVHFPLLKNFSHHTLPWVLPDTLYFCSVVEWNMHALRCEWPALYHLNILYPYSYVTFFGHPLYGESLFFLFADRCLHLDLHRSLVLYMLLSFWLGGLGCFLLARELTGRALVGYLGAFLFILNPFFYSIGQQLNVQSFYWSGFILFFLARLVRRPDWKSGAGLFLFCFLQGLFEIYHGFFVMGITIPLFFAFGVLFKALNRKKALILGASLLAGIALNVLMYLPFPRAIRTFELHRKLDYRSLIDASYLLGPSSPLNRGTGTPLAFLLMGGGAAALFAFAFLDRRRPAIGWWAAIPALIAAAFLAGTLAWTWGANALLIAFLVCFSCLVFRRSAGLPVLWKIGWGVMLAQLLVFFRFDGLLPAFSLSLFGLLQKVVPTISGLRYLHRGIFVLVPLFVALVAAGMAAALDRVRPAAPRWALLALVLLTLRLGIGYWRTGEATLPLDPAPYAAIEKESDRVLVEFPFWGSGRIIHHALYSINTMFHYDYLVNGRVAFRTDAVYRVFQDTADTYVPPTGRLRRLLENYSADYLVFHWDLMRQKKLLTEERIAELRSRIIAAADYVRVLADEKPFLVLRLKENFPLQVLRRCYSAFHLSRRDIVVELEEPYTKEIRAFLGRKPAITARVSRSGPGRFRLSFPTGDFDIRGNPVEIRFAEPVRIRDIRLEKRQPAIPGP
jgi:hypothetical protein